MSVSKYILWANEWLNMKYGCPFVPKGWNLKGYVKDTFATIAEIGGHYG